jgi:hypothetical protein
MKERGHMRVKLRPYIDLFKEGYVYKANGLGVTFTNKKYSWATFEPHCFEQEYIVGETLDIERYETYKDLFEEIQD